MEAGPGSAELPCVQQVSSTLVARTVVYTLALQGYPVPETTFSCCWKFEYSFGSVICLSQPNSKPVSQSTGFLVVSQKDELLRLNLVSQGSLSISPKDEHSRRARIAGRIRVTFAAP